MLFFLLFMCYLKFNFESIVLPISVTDETDFMVISPIWKSILYKISGYVILIHTTRIKAIAISKIADLTFC